MNWKLPKVYRGRVCILATLGAAITSIGIFLTCYGFPHIVKSSIGKNIVLRENSESFNLWRDSSFPLEFKIYIFNVTNPEDVTSKGRNPILQELGPYVYKEYRFKENITFEDETKMTYFLKKVFVFDKEKSKPFRENDAITILNTAMMGMVLTVNKQMKGMLGNINRALPYLFTKLKDPFDRCTVRDFLFDGLFIDCTSSNSIADIICSNIVNNLPPRMRLSENPEGFFVSMLSHMNNSLEGPYTIATGVEDLSQMGQVVCFNNLVELPMWENECNQIKGTDSTIFAPMDDKQHPKTIHVFQPEICRSVYVEYKKKNSVSGFPVFQYEVGKSLFQSNTANPQNQCFCPEDWSVSGVGCSLDGVMGAEKCQEAPSVVSFPHFYLGSPSLLEYADGLKPDKLKHQTFVDIEPRTGAVLRGAKRLQYNMELANIKEIDVLQNITTGLLPLLWVEEGGDVPPNVKLMLDDIYMKVKMMKVIQWVIITAGVVLALGACGLRGAGRVNGGGGDGGRVTLGGGIERPAAASRDGRSYDFSNKAFGMDDTTAHK